MTQIIFGTDDFDKRNIKLGDVITITEEKHGSGALRAFRQIVANIMHLNDLSAVLYSSNASQEVLQQLSDMTRLRIVNNVSHMHAACKEDIIFCDDVTMLTKEQLKHIAEICRVHNKLFIGIKPRYNGSGGSSSVLYISDFVVSAFMHVGYSINMRWVKDRIYGIGGDFDISLKAVSGRTWVQFLEDMTALES